MGACTSSSYLRRIDRYKQFYAALNTKNSASLSFDAMTQVQNLPKQYKCYYDYIIDKQFIQNAQCTEIDFDTFVDLCASYDDLKKASCCATVPLPSKNQSEHALTPIAEQQTSRKSVHDTFANWMAPVKDKELDEIINVIEKLAETSNDNEGLMSLNRALGLQSRTSFDIVYRPKKFKEKADNDFLTEAEISILIDKLAENGIDIMTIISSSTVKAASGDAIDALRSQGMRNDSFANVNHDAKQASLAKLLIKEYDSTHSGTLSTMESKNLFHNIKREIEAHQFFLGSNLKVVGDYITGRTLGFGQTAIVKCGVKRETLEQDQEHHANHQAVKQVALKIIKQSKKAKLGDLVLTNLEKDKYCQGATEIEVLSAVQHDFMVQMFENFQYQDPASQSNWQVLAMTLCGGGSLAEYRASTYMTEPIARYFFTQIVLVVEELHSHGFAHMDLKLENILLDNEGNVRVSDFGTALKFTADGSDLVKAGTIAGTLSHMPPEILEFQDDYHAVKADMYQLGVLYYQLLTGKHPFQVKNGNETAIISNIKASKFEPLGMEFTSNTRQLCNLLMSDDPQERPTADQVIDVLTQLELHKPAMAKSMVLLDPMPNLMELEQKLSNILKDEQLVYKSLEIGPDQENVVLRMGVKTQDSLLQFSITGEKVDADKEEHDYFDLQFESMQTERGARMRENISINEFKLNATALKLSFYMKQGILWEYQKLFRRIRYCILINFTQHESRGLLSHENSLNHINRPSFSNPDELTSRMERKPAIESVLSLQQCVGEACQEKLIKLHTNVFE